MYADTAPHPSEHASIVASEGALTSGIYTKTDLCLVRGEGSRVWDANGRAYLDFVAGIGTLSIGHCHPVQVEAIRRQAGRMISCTELYYNDARAGLLERLNRITPAGFKRFFLCNSGTEAVEAALKFARLTSGHTAILSFEGSFHGRTMGALSATAKASIREPFAPLVPDFHIVGRDDTKAVRSAVAGGKLAAIIFEPIQGEGGVAALPAKTMAALKEARADGVLLIADEIQCGTFRTGRPFAFEHEVIEPDFICLAKALGGGMPIGAVAIGDRVSELPKGCHGSTYGGTPLACVAASAVLDIIEAEGLAHRAAAKGDEFRSFVRALESPVVSEVRGRGLMLGIQLTVDPKPYLAAMRERGLLALTAGTNCIRMLPPYNTPDDVFAEARAILGDALMVEPTETATQAV